MSTVYVERSDVQRINKWQGYVLSTHLLHSDILVFISYFTSDSYELLHFLRCNHPPPFLRLCLIFDTDSGQLKAADNLSEEP